MALNYFSLFYKEMTVLYVDDEPAVAALRTYWRGKDCLHELMIGPDRHNRGVRITETVFYGTWLRPKYRLYRVELLNHGIAGTRQVFHYIDDAFKFINTELDNDYNSFTHAGMPGGRRVRSERPIRCGVGGTA